MKRFARYITIFVFPIIVICITIEICVRSFPNAYKYKYEWMQRNADSVETLVLGNSYTYYGIQPKYLEGKAFNLANPAQRFEHDLFLLKYWSDRYSKLKLVIMPVSSITMFSRGQEPYRCRYYKMYMDCNLYPTSFYYNFEISEPKIALSRFYKCVWGTNVVDWFCDEYGNEAFNNTLKKSYDWENTFKPKTAKTWNYISQNCFILEEIIKFCKKRNIQFVLITTPYWHTFYERLDEKQLNKMYSIIHDIQERYNIPYYNYHNDKRFTAADFFNNSHLSNVGEIKFTKILNKDIQKYIRHNNIALGN